MRKHIGSVQVRGSKYPLVLYLFVLLILLLLFIVVVGGGGDGGSGGVVLFFVCNVLAFKIQEPEWPQL